MKPTSSESATQRRLSALLLASSLLLLATLLGALALAPAGQPFAPHPEHVSMLRSGGDGSHPAAGWGYAVGLAILLLMTASILLGVSKAGRLGTLGRTLIVGCALTALVFTCLVLAYGGAPRDAAEPHLVAGFPSATAWMLYGIWWFPALMLLAISRSFRRDWLTEDDVARFRAALGTSSAGPGRAGGGAE